MERRAAAGARAWLAFLGRAIVFPLAWAWALGVARRHEEADARGRTRVLAGIAVGALLAAGGAAMLYGFYQDARVDMYTQTEGRLAVAVGDSAYEEQITTIDATTGQLQVLERNLAAAREAGDEANATIFESSIANATMEREEARAAAADLEENHRFFLRIQPWIRDQQDERVLQAIREADLSASEATLRQVGNAWDPDRMVPRAERAFAINDDAEQDMMQVMVFLLVPGLIGVLYAPMVFALSSILLRAWEPSDTVGYKPYPGKALAWFLLLGGFGWPSLLFSAWGFKDIEQRTLEGQIAL